MTQLPETEWLARYAKLRAEVNEMATPDTKFPGPSGGEPQPQLDLRQLLAAAAAARGGAASGPTPEKLRAAAGTLLRMTLARDERGKRLRDAFREIGAAVLEIMQDMAKFPPEA